MGNLRLFIGIYNSLSPSMTGEELAKVYNESLKQYLTSLYNNKNVPLSLYYNGMLLSWIEKNHPEYITVLEELVQRRQVEILTAPYNEPLLPVVPVSDRLGQMEKMTTYLRKLFKKRFRGCWLPGLVWEPSLASNLNGAGVNYTFLEVEQFERSGVKRVYEPVMTEDQGRSVLIFPLHRVLSDSAVKAPPHNIIGSLKKIANESQDERLVNLMFPGEFFAQPDKLEWLELFLQLVESNREWINCSLPSSYMKEKEGPWKRSYFNSSTYGDLKRYFHDKEMFLPDINHPGENDSYRAILNSNHQQAFYFGRVNYVTLLINSIRGDKARKKSARENLWKAQNIYNFWSGEMAYRSKLNGYINLIEAEKTTREKGIFNSSVIETDYDLDSQNEFVFQGLVYNGCVHLAGGALFEFSYLPSCWNYCYNRFGRSSFIDSFLTDDYNRESYYERRSVLNGAAAYRYHRNNCTRDEKQVIIRGDMDVTDIKGEHTPIKVLKKYLFKRNWFVVSYSFENRSEWSRDYHFCTEINLSLPGVSEGDLDISFVTSREKSDINGYGVSNCASVLVVDKANNTDIQLDFGEDMELWYYVEKDILTIIPRSLFTLYPREKKELTVSLKIGRHKN